MQLIPVMGKLSAVITQSLVSHGPSEIILISWFVAQETFNIIINVKNICATDSFCENNDTFRILRRAKFKSSIYLK